MSEGARRPWDAIQPASSGSLGRFECRSLARSDELREVVFIRLQAGRHEKRLFEDRITQFLDLISRMDERKLERALGRLLDFMRDAETDYEKAQIQLRGQIIQAYLALRKAGIKKRRIGVGVVRAAVPWDKCDSFPRMKFLEDPFDYQLRCATEAELITEEAFGVMNQILDTPIDERVKLLSP